jgi:hypothetical protein
MADVRRNLIKLGTFALATSAMLGVATDAGLAGATASTSHSTTSHSTTSHPTTSHPTTAHVRKDQPDTLSGIKASAHSAITKRINSLHAADTSATKAKTLGSDQGTLVSHLGADVAPLQQLDQKIQGDTTQTQAANDSGTIYTGFRVYRLVLPASRIAAAADRDTATTIPTLSADVKKAQGYVNSGNTARLQPLIDDLNTQIAAATKATNGLAAAVLAYTPAQVNANPNLLKPATASDKTARNTLKKARSDVKQIRKLLKSEGTTHTGLKGAGQKHSKHHHHHHHAGGSTTTTAAPAPH